MNNTRIVFPNITINNLKHYNIISKIKNMMKILEDIQRDLSKLCKSVSVYEFMQLRLEIKRKLFKYNTSLQGKSRTDAILESVNLTLDKDVNVDKTLTEEERDTSSRAITALLSELNLEFEYTKSKNEFINDVEKIIEDEYKLIKGLIKILEKQDVDVSQLIQKSKNSNCIDVRDQINKLGKIVDDDILETGYYLTETVDEFGLPISCCNVEATKTLIALNDEKTISEQELISRDTDEMREIRKKTILAKKIKTITSSNETIDYIASTFSTEELLSISIMDKKNTERMWDNTWNPSYIGRYINKCNREWYSGFVINERKKLGILKTYGTLPNADEQQSYETELYNHYVLKIGRGEKSIYGSYHKKTLNNLKFLNPNILLSSDHGFLSTEIYGLITLLSLFDTTLPYFKTSSYNQFLTSMLKLVMYPLGRAVYNFGWIAKQIVETINKKIGFKYIIFDCKEGIDSYTCGRGISEIEFNFDETLNVNTDFRILVHNTVSPDDDSVDIEHWSEIGQQMPESKGDTGTYLLENYN